MYLFIIWFIGRWGHEVPTYTSEHMRADCYGFSPPLPLLFAFPRVFPTRLLSPPQPPAPISLLKRQDCPSALQMPLSFLLHSIQGFTIAFRRSAFSVGSWSRWSENFPNGSDDLWLNSRGSEPAFEVFCVAATSNLFLAFLILVLFLLSFCRTVVSVFCFFLLLPLFFYLLWSAYWLL